MMFVGDFKGAHDAGPGIQQRKAALEASFPDSVRDDFQIAAGITAGAADRLPR